MLTPFYTFYHSEGCLSLVIRTLLGIVLYYRSFFCRLLGFVARIVLPIPDCMSAEDKGKV